MNFKTKFAFLIIAFMVSLASAADLMDDVGIYQIVTPVGVIHEGMGITPSVMVKNFGNAPQTFTVALIFSGYTSSREVTGLDPGKMATVNFDSWTADEPGTYPLTVNTQLEGDQNAANDMMQDTFQVIDNLHDVGVTTILVPVGLIKQGMVVTPIATVANYGTETETFDVTLVFDDYSSTKEVAGLDPGTTLSVNFDYWTANDTDTYSSTVYTNLDMDENGANDTIHGSFEVVGILHDVGVTTILAPVGEIPQEMDVIPSATVGNFGTETETFDVTFEIGGYTSTQAITDLAPGEMATVNFDSWSADVTGTYTVTVYTKLAGDEIPANDVMHDSITVNP